MRYTSSLKNEIPRPAALNNASISTIGSHVFGNVSIVASCAVVYAVVHHPSVTNQGLVVCKSRISKKNLTISRLDFVSTQMALNVIENVKTK